MNKIIINSIIASICTLFLFGCGTRNMDFIPDKTPDELYIEANKALYDDNFSKAIEYLEAIHNRYPFGPYAHQVQLNLIYSYYKDRENELALAEINNFIHMNPADEHIDYVYFMRGLTHMQMGTDRLLDILRIDNDERDSNHFELAFFDFRKIYTEYPKSLYAADAYARMVHIQDLLSKHELAIAKFYYKKGAYISSARRCQKILLNYRDSEQIEETLDILAKSYKKLNLNHEYQQIKDFKELNFK